MFTVCGVVAHGSDVLPASQMGSLSILIKINTIRSASVFGFLSTCFSAVCACSGYGQSFRDGQQNCAGSRHLEMPSHLREPLASLHLLVGCCLLRFACIVLCAILLNGACLCCRLLVQWQSRRFPSSSLLVSSRHCLLTC